MRELARITATVTRIEYGFDESEFGKEGVNKHTVKGEQTIVKVDGKICYDKYITGHVMVKRHKCETPVDCFWTYMVQLFPENKPQCCSNTGCNRCYDLHFLGQRRFKVFNFKKQLLNIRLKQLFLRLKTSFGKKF